MSLGEKIVELRKEKKWSQEDLSERIDIHARHISRWENNKTIPSVEALKRLANALGVTTDYLLYDNVPKDGKAQVQDLRLLEQFKKVEQFKEEDKETVINLIDAMIMKKQMMDMVKT